VQFVLDWLAREGGIVLGWWALVTLAGAAAFPLCARLLGGLPDRGYTLARAVGLLVTAFVFWLLASLGFMRNATGNITLTWVLVLIGGLIVYVQARAEAVDWRAWWRANRAAIIAAEALFLGLLFTWALVRAHNPELSNTEKPMEMMMLNSVMRSETFPPHDAWLSDYSISYYYFGYVIAAMLTMMSGVSGAVGFSMTNALLFALTGLTAFGVAYNLVRSCTVNEGTQPASARPAVLAGLLAMFMMVIMGNWQVPIVEIPYLTQPGNDAYLQFWDTQSRGNSVPNAAPITSLDWFRASRVLVDRQLNGELEGIQPIDEFPQFSFLLADNHPHVLALPFAALALGLALNVALRGRAPKPLEIVFYGVCLGGLVFLNTWDGPIYMVVLVGAEMLRRLIQQGKLVFGDWMEGVFLGVALVVLTLLLYLPFFIGFRSQASGILPNVIWGTGFQQYFVMFGPFVVLLIPFLILEVWRGGRRVNWRAGLMTAGILIAALLGIIVVLVVVGVLNPQFLGIIQEFINMYGGVGGALPAILARRLEPLRLLTTLVLLVGVVLVVARLFPRRVESEGNAAVEPPYAPATAFALLLVGVGVLLTFLPEYVYLRDNFGTRMNTVFKFYYQAWVAFSVAGGYAVYTLLDDARLPLPAAPLRVGYGVLVAAVVVLGAFYPVLANYNHMGLEWRTLNPENATALTLDGGDRMLQSYDDYVVIMCLADLVEADDGVAVEAVLGSYWAGTEPDSGRIGALTGIPTVLGWENHQGQWRGTLYWQIVGSRRPDIIALYEESRWEAVLPIIERYGIAYILYGYAERLSYAPSGEQKFIENTDLVCESGNSRVYRVREAALASG
jgi:YYY domain-containing protein